MNGHGVCFLRSFAEKNTMYFRGLPAKNPQPEAKHEEISEKPTPQWGHYPKWQVLLKNVSVMNDKGRTRAIQE